MYFVSDIKITISPPAICSLYMYSTAHRVLVFLIIYLYSNHDLPPLRPPWGEAPRDGRSGGRDTNHRTTTPPQFVVILPAWRTPAPCRTCSCSRSPAGPRWYPSRKGLPKRDKHYYMTIFFKGIISWFFAGGLQLLLSDRTYFLFNKA